MELLSIKSEKKPRECVDFENFLNTKNKKFEKHGKTDTIGKGVCRCISAEHGDNELELGPDDILVDGLLKKGVKEQNQLEVAIGDGMEFTIHGDLKSKSKKGKLMNNTAVSIHDFSTLKRN